MGVHEVTIHLNEGSIFPVNHESYFLLMLRFMSGLTCANTVNVFSFFNLLWSTEVIFSS